MALIDPAGARLLKIVEKFTLKIHELDPREMEPIGDRYIVETLEVDEDILFGSILVKTQGTANGPDDDPRNPAAKHETEKRGVLPAVVCAIGDGHLLGIPDARLAVRNQHGYDEVVRIPSDVPSFLKVGDVCLVDINARGRALRLAGREIRVVNQIDCLVRLKVRLDWTDTGWQRE